jgi:hypothetical protein
MSEPRPRKPYKTAPVFCFDDAITSLWKMLQSGDVCQRAGAILLIREIATTLIVNGKYEEAARLVQTFRRVDPKTKDAGKPMKVW